MATYHLHWTDGEPSERREFTGHDADRQAERWAWKRVNERHDVSEHDAANDMTCDWRAVDSDGRHERKLFWTWAEDANGDDDGSYAVAALVVSRK